MRIAIVGCGSIGNKRAEALGGHALVACADTIVARAEHLAMQHPDCIATPEWQRAIEHAQAVIVSTTNDMLVPVALAAVQSGKHVLVEKPAGRTCSELQTLRDAAHSTGVVVKVGFNHRFHPGLIKARQLVDEGAVGPLMFVRARYGHGGRLGMEKEWRGKRAISGGGEMLDQGIHLIDLARWFLGDFADVSGHIARFFWDWEVEDNGFAILKTRGGQVAWLHASCTEWKNLFSFEIYGRDGKIHIEGLGGSYGIERLTYHRMLPQMGPPQTSAWEFPGEDMSWQAEFAHFVDCTEHRRVPSGSLDDALAALQIVEQLYALDKEI